MLTATTLANISWAISRSWFLFLPLSGPVRAGPGLAWSGLVWSSGRPAARRVPLAHFCAHFWYSLCPTRHKRRGPLAGCSTTPKLKTILLSSPLSGTALSLPSSPSSSSFSSSSSSPPAFVCPTRKPCDKEASAMATGADAFGLALCQKWWLNRHNYMHISYFSLPVGIFMIC